MPLQSSASSSDPLCLSEVRTELGLSTSTTLCLGSTAVRTLAGKPSGTICLSDLLGKGNAAGSPGVGNGGTKFGPATTDILGGQSSVAWIISFANETTSIVSMPGLRTNDGLVPGFDYWWSDHVPPGWPDVYGACGLNSTTTGYALFGVIGQSKYSDGTAIFDIQKVTFRNEAVSKATTSVTYWPLDGTGCSNSSYGIFGHGSNQNFTGLVGFAEHGRQARLTFSSDAIDIQTAYYGNEFSGDPRLHAYQQTAGINSTTNAYFCGGAWDMERPETYYSRINKYSFSSYFSRTQLAATLETPVCGPAGYNSGTNGYVAAGTTEVGFDYSGTFPRAILGPGNYFKINKISFSTETRSLTSSNLSVTAANRNDGWNSFNNGYISHLRGTSREITLNPGDDGYNSILNTSAIEAANRMSFSTETLQMLYVTRSDLDNILTASGIPINRSAVFQSNGYL